ncbi:Polysaccharide deacetylase [uncultured archaeon]|nr:Polysaccharide deacetylase [uncultured archaeon]
MEKVSWIIVDQCKDCNYLEPQPRRKGIFAISKENGRYMKKTSALERILSLSERVSGARHFWGTGSDSIPTSKRETLYLPILAYHKVADAPEPYDPSWVTRQLFAGQMAALHAYGYTSISFRDLVHFRKDGAQLPSRPIILTFDDGYECVYSVARQLLNTYGFMATCFLSTDYIKTTKRCDNSWDADDSIWPASMMLWTEAAVMQAEGHNFEAHTLSHPFLNALHPIQAYREIAGAKAEIEKKLSTLVTCFAYPFGSGFESPFLRLLVALCGYRAAVSYDTGLASLATSDLMALPRIKITELNSVDLDPAHPEAFFMRVIDPSFALPSISIDHIEITDAWGNSSRAAFAPGDRLTVRVYAANCGSAVNVAASLQISGNAGDCIPAVFDSHPHADIYKKPFAHGASLGFTYDVRIPENASAGKYRLKFSVHDAHYVLRYFISTDRPDTLLRIEPTELAH